MLYNVRDRPGFSQHTVSSDEPKLIDIRAIFSTLLRHWRIVLLSTIAVVTLTIVYVLTATQLYTASARLMVDPRRVQVFGQAKQDNSVLTETLFDSASIDSLVTTVSSESVLRRVVSALNFTEDPEFNGAYRNIVERAISQATATLSSNEPSTEAQQTRSAIDFIAKRLVVQRAGLTFGVNINYTAASADSAARVTNAIAEALVNDQQLVAVEVLQKASNWLETRLVELRDQATRADYAVLDFKVANRLVDVAGTLVNDQQITQTSTQLSAARAQTADAKARLDRIEQVSNSGSPDAVVSDAVRNEVINTLLGRLSDASRRASELATRFGEGHTAVVLANAEVTEFRKSIGEEIRRMAAGYRSDYEIARAREQALEQTLQDLFRQLAESRQLQVKLKELESASQSSRMLYDTLLQRYDLALQQQSFPVSAIRIITHAVPPGEKSWPKSWLLLVVGSVVGAGLGLGGALLKDALDTSVRTTEQLEAITGVECLSLIPIVAPPSRSRRWFRTKRGRDCVTFPIVFDFQFSKFSEAFRRLRLSIDERVREDERVVAFVSSVHGEGKSTCALGLASLMARTGSKVLLIDADFHNAGLSGQLTPDIQSGLSEVLNNGLPLQQVIVPQEGGPDLLPSGMDQGSERPSELISSRRMSEILQTARLQYEYVILDLPALDQSIDALSMAAHVDTFVYVVGWGGVQGEAIQTALSSSPAIRKKLVGAVLNKVDLKALRHFATRSSPGAAE